MSIFAKDYDKEISNLVEAHNKLVEQIDNNTKANNSLQDDIIQLAKIQANHKEIITFLINNAQFDADKSEEIQLKLMEMLKNIRETNDKN
jgi:hypothetical protein